MTSKIKYIDEQWILHGDNSKQATVCVINVCLLYSVIIILLGESLS